MLKYLIQVVRDALAVGMLAGLLPAFDAAAGAHARPKRTAWGVLAGVGAAAALAALRSASVIRRRDYINLTVLPAAIVAEILFLLIIWGLLSKKAPETHRKLRGALSVATAALLPVHSMTGVFLYMQEFVRAGESVFGADVLLRVTGFLCGLLIIALTGTSLYRTADKLGEGRLRILLTAGLAVNIVGQAASVLQTLMSRRMIPVAGVLFKFVTFSVNNSDLFLYAVMALALLSALLMWLRRPPPDDTFQNPAQRRRALASRRSVRRWCAVTLAGCVLSVLSMTALRALAEREVVLSPAEPMDIVQGRVVLPLERIDDGHLHRFAYTAADGVEVRFIVIKKNDVSFGVGLDACDICGPTGYYERDDEVICKLCDVVMNKSTIGFKGGCNPVPLAFAIESGSMVIDTQSLEDESSRFR
ncbi:MAG: Fe-S-containing protein [Oscillospiraceae bacterium]|jgi:uncharacterized membrane protein|nr:Fe-S-containing protein [Oscillospiraceae bacterium]